MVTDFAVPPLGVFSPPEPPPPPHAATPRIAAAEPAAAMVRLIIEPLLKGCLTGGDCPPPPAWKPFREPRGKGVSAGVLDRFLRVEVAVAVNRRPATADAVADRSHDCPPGRCAGREDHPGADGPARRVQHALAERVGRVAVHRH